MSNSDTSSEFIFLPDKNNELGIIINKKANELFYLLKNFDTTRLHVDDIYKNYFINHHLDRRLFFSIQSSADIIYHSVRKTNKVINEINFVDYGAGLGTLYMLAGMLKFKSVLYNDYLPEWKETARAVCDIANIDIDAYITGDIDNVLKYAEEKGIKLDIIASRNVIEHIYSLSRFYIQTLNHNPDAIIYSTTTANYHNPAMLLKHIIYHKKVEKDLAPARKAKIAKLYPSLNENQLDTITSLTRGLAGNDFTETINKFVNNISVKPVKYLYTNTCDPETGYWLEYIIPRKDHKNIILSAGYNKMEYTAGFWDTHYKYLPANLLAKFLNKLINLSGRRAYVIAPFVNIVAYN